MDNSAEDIALIERLKVHYVAITRPFHLPCLPMRKDVFTPAELGRELKRLLIGGSRPKVGPQVSRKQPLDLSL